MGDRDPLIEALLARYSGGTDPVVDLQMPSIPMPAGSAAMQERGPWMRQYLHPQLVDLLARLLQHAPSAFPASRAGTSIGWASSIEHGQPMQNIGGGQMVPVDPGIAGGPSTARAGNFLDRVLSTQALRNASNRPVEVVDPYDVALQRQGWQKPANDRQ